MLSEGYLQKVIDSKDCKLAAEEADSSHATVSWAICDGALIIYDYDDPPEWFKFPKNDDGDTFDELAMTVSGKG